MRIDLRDLRRGWPIAFSDEAGEYAARCSTVDRDQRCLDGIMKVTQVARVLPGRGLFDELQEVGRDAWTCRNQ